MQLTVPDRPGPSGMSERQPNRHPIPDPQHTPHEGGNGSLGLPPPPTPEKSVLNRTVERTHVLYERNSWVFLPPGESGKHSLGVPKLQGEQQPYSGGVNRPEVPPPKEL